MMEKVVEAGSWTGAGMDRPASLVKISSRGLIGHDRSEFLKFASHVFAEQLDRNQLKFAEDELPIHLNAIGATEGYGCNRNGDGFTEKTCQDHHRSFVEHARYYANHQNKDPDKSFGVVKLSAYNPRMRRIELLVAGNMNKAAATRNGGLVMKEATLKKLQRGELVPFSMACKVAYDVCSNCMQKSANRSQYCSEDTCISPTTGRRGFGCASGLTKVAGDGFQQFVDNPNPQFFDISEVVRNADRIARGSLADYVKAASENHVVGGAELAEFWAGQGATFSLQSFDEAEYPAAAAQLKLARELAAIERDFAHNVTPQDRAFARGLASPADPITLPAATTKVAAWSELHREQILLPLAVFLKVAGQDSAIRPENLEQVQRHLPGVFGRLVQWDKFASVASTNPYLAASRATGPATGWAAKYAADYSLRLPQLQDRVVRSALTKCAATDYILPSKMILHAADDSPVEQLARQYAMYKLAFLLAVPADVHHGTLRRLVVQHNYLQQH